MMWKILRLRYSVSNVALFSKYGYVWDNGFVQRSIKARSLYTQVIPAERTAAVEQSKDQHCVTDEVSRLLEMSKPTFVNGRYVKAKLSARRLAKIRKQYISDGYYWPEKPLRDRSLDMTSKGSKKEKLREERQKLIEENMKKMPQMIAEYRAKMKNLRATMRESNEKQKQKQLEAQRLGYHPKDPRGLQKLLQAEALESKKKKRMQKKIQSSI